MEESRKFHVEPEDSDIVIPEKRIYKPLPKENFVERQPKEEPKKESKKEEKGRDLAESQNKNIKIVEENIIDSFKNEVKHNQLLKKHNLELVNKNNYSFYRIFTIIFLILLVSFGIVGSYLVYDGKFQSIINSTQICSNSTLNCEKQTCSPQLTCPTIPSCNCPSPTINCRCGNST